MTSLLSAEPCRLEIFYCSQIDTTHVCHSSNANQTKETCNVKQSAPLSEQRHYPIMEDCCQLYNFNVGSALTSTAMSSLQSTLPPI